MRNLRNIIVTGSSKGIGYGLVSKLASKQSWNIIMACRDIKKAEEAQGKIKNQFPDSSINVQKLDITNEESILQFKATIASKYKQVDVVVNNAGVNVKKQICNMQQFDYIFNTNFYSTINFTEHILPFVKRSGKVIFVSGMVGKLTFLKNQQLKNKFKDQHLTQQKLYALMNKFKQSIKNGTVVEEGWPKSTYTVSKLGINLYAYLLGTQKQILDQQIQVYSMCPGYTKTDLTGNKGVQTVQKATLPFVMNPQIQGRFFQKALLSSYK